MNRGVKIALILGAAACVAAGVFLAGNAYRVERPAVEAEAAARLRSYALAQQQFHGAEGRYGSVEELRARGLVGQDWADSMSLGPYRLEFEVLQKGKFFHARAEPWEARLSHPFFYVDSNSQGRVRSSADGMAGPKDPFYETE
jgi:hypothetical protein